MAEVLMINVQDLKTLTPIEGNVDSDFITPFIKIAQDKHILPVLGTNLFDKIKELIEDDELDNAGNESYKELHELIKPCLAHYVNVDYIPFNTYKLKNASVTQGTPENAIPISKSEMDALIGLAMDTAESYLSRIEEYLCANSEDLPEYNSNTSGDVYPQSPRPFHGLTF